MAIPSENCRLLIGRWNFQYCNPLGHWQMTRLGTHSSWQKSRSCTSGWSFPSHRYRPDCHHLNMGLGQRRFLQHKMNMKTQYHSSRILRKGDHLRPTIPALAARTPYPYSLSFILFLPFRRFWTGSLETIPSLLPWRRTKKGPKDLLSCSNSGQGNSPGKAPS